MRSRLLAILLLGISARQADAAWKAPVGIPTPPVGINEVAPAPPSPWNSSAAGFYYVERSNPGCTDGANGYPAAPRCTIPISLPAGAVVELHGSYNFRHTSPNPITANGTATLPVFIRGQNTASRPVVLQTWQVGGAFYVIENIEFSISEQLILQGQIGTVRLCDIHGTAAGGGIAIFGAGGIVVSSNTIHHNGDSTGGAETDHHGIKIGGGTSSVWIVDNDIHHNSGDSIQISDATIPEPWPRYIFIARNTLHDDKENAIDIKLARDVIASENRMYGYHGSPSSPAGETTVTHGSSSGLPQRIWFLDNLVFGSAQGLVSSGAEGYYVIGNLIASISGADRPGSLFGPSAILSYGTSASLYANNTIWNVEAGISLAGVNVGYAVINNIVGNVFGNGTFHIGFGNTSAVTQSNVANNLLLGSGEVFHVGGATYQTLADFQAAFPGQCANCLTSDPLFVSATDLRLTAASPARDAGLDLSAINTSFKTAYGVDLNVDLAGVQRPQGSAWDIGAYEFLSGSACDVNQDNTIDVTDVQLCVNQAIGATACIADINQDGLCDVVDVQRAVNAALGGQCVVQ